MCFQCVDGFIYSLLYPPVTMYDVLLPTQPRASSKLSVKSHLEWWVVGMVLPLMLGALGQSPHVVTLGWTAPFIVALAPRRVLQLNVTLLFHLSVERGNFCMTLRRANSVTFETVVLVKCHKCNIRCHSAVHAYVPPAARPLSPTHMDIWRGLTRTWSEHTSTLLQCFTQQHPFPLLST